MRYSLFLPFFMLLLGRSTACTTPVPEDLTQEQQKVAFYIDKLPDRDFVDVYGDGENPKTWYTAAEKLGQMGANAIPALVQRLHTEDDYELMLVVYALMLASQDARGMGATQGDYLRLDVVLTPNTNPQNRQRTPDQRQRDPHAC